MLRSSVSKPVFKKFRDIIWKQDEESSLKLIESENITFLSIILSNNGMLLVFMLKGSKAKSLSPDLPEN